MWRHKKSDAPPSVFTVENRGDVEVLRIGPHEGLIRVDLDEINKLWEFLKQTSEERRKVLVILVSPGAFSPSNMSASWDRILMSPEAEGGCQPPRYPRQLDMIREENAFQRFETIVRGMDTIVVCALQGEILFPFLGPALACDYRVVTEDTVFINRCLEANMPPIGALPWFLSRFVGHGKAFDILFETESLTASEALQLGLVNRVVTTDRLEHEAVTRAEWFASKPAEGLAAAKQMMAASERHLETYLERETEVFDHCLAACHATALEGKGRSPFKRWPLPRHHFL